MAIVPATTLEDLAFWLDTDVACVEPLLGWALQAAQPSRYRVDDGDTVVGFVDVDVNGPDGPLRGPWRLRCMAVATVGDDGHLGGGQAQLSRAFGCQLLLGFGSLDADWALLGVLEPVHLIHV